MDGSSNTVRLAAGRLLSGRYRIELGEGGMGVVYLTADEVLSGGYAQKYDRKTGCQQVTGVQAARTIRGSKAAPGSPRERRARGWKDWQRSGRKLD